MSNTPKVLSVSIESTDTELHAVQEKLLQMAKNSALMKAVMTTLGKPKLRVTQQELNLNFLDGKFEKVIKVTYRVRTAEERIEHIPSILRELQEKLPGNWEYIG